MREQLGLDFSLDKPALVPKLEPKSATVEVVEPVNSAEYLLQLIEDKESMIYLYGENEHLCFIRTHSSYEAGGEYAIMRKEAEAILSGTYSFHCNHTSHDGRKARVYRERG